MLGLEAWPRPRGQNSRPRPRRSWPRPRPRGSWPRPRVFGLVTEAEAEARGDDNYKLLFFNIEFLLWSAT